MLRLRDVFRVEMRLWLRKQRRKKGDEADERKAS
jgi:hypothetical protein